MAVRRAAVAWAAAIAVSLVLLALPLVAFAATFTVNIQNSAFAPATRSATVGDTVTWTNLDPFSHTATSNTGAWDTGVIGANGSRSIVFNSAGTFAYHCNLHAFMTGTVVVQAATTPAPTPTPQPTPPPTPLPTVRTAAPTAARTAAPTAAPTVAPTEAATTTPATPTPSPSASPTQAAVETLAVSPSPSAVAAQLTPEPAASGGGLAPLVIGAAALAVVVLGGIAFYLARRP